MVDPKATTNWVFLHSWWWWVLNSTMGSLSAIFPSLSGLRHLGCIKMLPYNWRYWQEMPSDLPMTNSQMTKTYALSFLFLIRQYFYLILVHFICGTSTSFQYWQLISYIFSHFINYCAYFYWKYNFFWHDLCEIILFVYAWLHS